MTLMDQFPHSEVVWSVMNFPIETNIGMAAVRMLHIPVKLHFSRTGIAVSAPFVTVCVKATLLFSAQRILP